MQRIFIAFPLPADIVSEVAKIQQALKRHRPRAVVSWTKPESFHVTLHFFEKIDERQMLSLQGMVEPIAAKHRPFVYHLGRLDGFPDFILPRVLTIRLKDNREDRIIYDEITAELTKALIPFDQKAWTPHITLGRIRSRPYTVSPNEITMPRLSWTVRQIEIIKSELYPTGSKHSLVARYPLAAE